MLTKSIGSMLVLTSIFALLACSITADNETIMPLAVGNYWIYEVETYVDDAVDPITRSEHTRKIEEKITWGGHTWYGNEKDGAGEYHRNTKEGVFILQINDEHPDGAAKLLLEYPVKVGASWTVGTGPSASTMIVETLDETVIVPAGIFNDCLRCKMTMPDSPDMPMPAIMIHWIKPGVGAVKMQLDLTTGGESMGLELMRTETIYRLKKYHVK